MKKKIDENCLDSGKVDSSISHSHKEDDMSGQGDSEQIKRAGKSHTNTQTYTHTYKHILTHIHCAVQ